MTNGSSSVIFQKQCKACAAAVPYGFAKALTLYLQQTKQLIGRLYASKNNARTYTVQRGAAPGSL